MAVMGSVIFSRVVPQAYTGQPIIPSGDDIFVITSGDFEIYGEGVEITFNQLQDYCARSLTIECSNNTEVGVATINIIDSHSSGQFNTSGTFEIYKDFSKIYISLENLELYHSNIKLNYATKTYVENKGYITSSALEPLFSTYVFVA